VVGMMMMMMMMRRRRGIMMMTMMWCHKLTPLSHICPGGMMMMMMMMTMMMWCHELTPLSPIRPGSGLPGILRRRGLDYRARARGEGGMRTVTTAGMQG
jgi:hypothetical protein